MLRRAGRIRAGVDGFEERERERLLDGDWLTD